MTKKIMIYIIYAIWIIILVFNTICLFITWKNSLILGDLYYCDNNDKQYIKENVEIDYDFDYISVGHIFHGEYRVMAIRKNFIIFPNLISGTETIIQTYKNETSKIYSYFEEKSKSANKIDINIFYLPYISIYIICGISYPFIRKQLNNLTDI